VKIPKRASYRLKRHIIFTEYALRRCWLPIIGGGIKRWFCLTSLWRLSLSDGVRKRTMTTVRVLRHTTPVTSVSCSSRSTSSQPTIRSTRSWTSVATTPSTSCCCLRRGMTATRSASVASWQELQVLERARQRARPASLHVNYCWRRSIVVRTLVSAGELSLSCASLLAGWMTTLWLSRPLSVSQHGQLSQSSPRGW